MASSYPPRKRQKVDAYMRLSGLEPLTYQPALDNMRSTFLSIGERCNVAGSTMYKNAIVDGNYDKAAAIATKQVLAYSLYPHLFTLRVIRLGLSCCRCCH
jgi:5-methyltetrahydrofolate--homocysteine methyltransferase